MIWEPVMNISAYAIRNPVVVIMAFVLITLSGLMAFKSIPVQDFPDVELPIVTVSATLEGAAPAQLEMEVARKMEDSIATIQGVKHISTQIHDAEVNLIVEFVLEKDAAEAVTEVRDAIARIRSELPGDLREPSVSKATTAGRVVQTYIATSDSLDDESVSWFVDNKFTKHLLAVPGVGSVKRIGGVTREVLVELDPTRLSSFGITPLEVSRRLKMVQQESAGGRGDVGGFEQGMRTVATVRAASDLGAISIPLGDGRRVLLRDVATIQDTVAEPRSLALFNGGRVVGIEIFRSRGSSEVTVANAVRQAVEEIEKQYPKVQLREVINNAAPIKENFDGSMNMLYEGALLAVIVVWIFLRNFRATFIAAAALPLSVLPAFLCMAYFGFSLNTVTLLSLALVIGILVDDAIVELENIERHLKIGKTPFQAAMEATSEIGLAVVATTFALVAVFLPTAFMGGIAGKFFKQFGWTAVVAILASLLVARFLTPLMAAYLLKSSGVEANSKDGLAMGVYMRAMHWCLGHRKTTASAAIAFFVASVALIGLLPTGFVPASDRAQTMVNIELPPGAGLRDTSLVAEQARQILRGINEVRDIYSSIGGGSSGDVFAPGADAEARRAVLTVLLTHASERNSTIKDVEAVIRKKLSVIPSVRFKVGAQDNGVKMQIVLRGEDPEVLAAAARLAERDLRTLKGIGAVTSGASLVRPEIMVRPDLSKAADFGVTTADIGQTVRVATSGDYKVELAKLELAERQVPIRVKLPDSVRGSLALIGRLNVSGTQGPVMLASVAQLSIEGGPAHIYRLDRSRNVTFEVELGSRNLGELYQEAMNLPAFKNLPTSVRVAELGDTQEMKALFASFGVAMGIGVLCIYGVLVLLFKDFMQPLTILVALPLSMGGAFIGLLLTGSSMSMPAMIGLLMLMGVVTKNSILLVEYAIVARRNGMNRFDALVDACHKRSRPIVMTTIAMGAGMLPMALGMGANASFRAPMAIAVIGGLITSTLLSLLVIPPVFTFVDDLREALQPRRLSERLKTKLWSAGSAWQSN